MMKRKIALLLALVMVGTISTCSVAFAKKSRTDPHIKPTTQEETKDPGKKDDPGHGKKDDPGHGKQKDNPGQKKKKDNPGQQGKRIEPSTTQGYEHDIEQFKHQKPTYDANDTKDSAPSIVKKGEDGGPIVGIWVWHTYDEKWTFRYEEKIYEDEWATCYNPYTHKESWFYFDENRNALEGWQWIKGSDGHFQCYYLNSLTDDLDKCAMAHSGTIDGKTLNAQGIWVTDLQAELREYPYYPHNYILPEKPDDRKNMR